MKRYAFLFAVALAVCGATLGDVWYVDKANSSGTEDGTSWGTAFTGIHDGIGAATSSDEVWVAAETYYESVTLVSDVSVYGGFAGTELLLSERDIASNPTTINGSPVGEQTIGADTWEWTSPMHTHWEDERTQIIYLAGEIGSVRQITSLALDVTTVPGQTMNNWTIRMKHTSLSSYTPTDGLESSGWTTVYQNNETVSSTGWVTFNFSTSFHYNGTDNLMIDFSYNNDSSATDGRCHNSVPGGIRTVYAYSANAHGDPLAWSGTTDPAVTQTATVPNIKLIGHPYHAVVMDSTTNARIDGFAITGGIADGSSQPESTGGGVLAVDADSTNMIANCTVTGNTAELGSGVFLSNSSPLVANCTISGNGAADSGGGVVCFDGSSPWITNCVISGNTAELGSGLFCSNSSPTIINSTISRNEAISSGGGVYCSDGSSPSITNTIFEGNTNQAIYEYDATSDPIVANCLFYGNPDGDYYDYDTTTYTGGDDINTNVPEASGNVDGDPLFVMDGPAAITGIWTAVTPGVGATTLTDDSASFTPDALVGKLINADASQRHQTLITANTGTSITAIGDLTGYVESGDAYLVVDHHLRFNSPCIDTGTYSGAPSADFDGEPRPIDVPGLGLDGLGVEYDIGADEYVDTDGDGLSDYYEERVLGTTDPADADSDDDGLNDGDEVNTHGTDPNDTDSDDDTLPDGWEVDGGLDPTDDTGDNGVGGDPDADGLTNGAELANGTDPSNPDSDDDGLSDGDEVNVYGTDPADPDSDDDTYLDGVEVDHGTDPNNAGSVPTNTLTVVSLNPNSGVSISVSPVDNNADGDGTTQFTRIYNMGVSVTLTAPAIVGNNEFEKWQRDGLDYSTNRVVTPTLNTDSTMTAVYVRATYELYAPWYYESVSDAIGEGGGLVDGVLSFVSVRNASDQASTLQITYLSGAGDEEGPYEVVVSAGEAIAWSPYSDTGGAEMAGIPNASFAAGSVKVESTHPVVGRVIQVEVSDGMFVSMASQPLVEESESVNDTGTYEVYAPWYYESVSDAVGDGGELVDGVLSFVSVRNASDQVNTLQITYLSGAGDEEGPYEVVVSAGEAVAWSPYSDTGGAEMPGIANASFAAGSVKVESTHPVVGRVIQVEVSDGMFVSMASQPLVEK